MTFKRFRFKRSKDVSGVSGTGYVAEGVQFSNGAVTISWQVPGKPNSTTNYRNVATAMEIHGHEGGTVIEWIDKD
jgi:hypothetical protein